MAGGVLIFLFLGTKPVSEVNRPHPPAESLAALAALAASLKSAERLVLWEMTPTDAQKSVDSILHPQCWKVTNWSQWSWSGDLGDPAGDPLWLIGRGPEEELADESS